MKEPPLSAKFADSRSDFIANLRAEARRDIKNGKNRGEDRSLRRLKSLLAPARALVRAKSEVRFLISLRALARRLADIPKEPIFPEPVGANRSDFFYHFFLPFQKYILLLLYVQEIRQLASVLARLPFPSILSSDPS